MNSSHRLIDLLDDVHRDQDSVVPIAERELCFSDHVAQDEVATYINRTFTRTTTTHTTPYLIVLAHGIRQTARRKSTPAMAPAPLRQLIRRPSVQR